VNLIGKTILLLLLATAIAASPTVKPVCELGEYASVYITGSFVEIQVHDSGPYIPLRIFSQPASTSQKPSFIKSPFIGVVNEGAIGGNWGLSVSSDDDCDGRVNEDRFDGVDNDGDGLIDEDFALIGHQMSVSDNRSNSHIETYHWEYVSLKHTLFLALNKTDNGLTMLSSTEDWQIAPLDFRNPKQVFYATAAGDKLIGAILLDRSDVPRIDRGTLGLLFKGNATWAITIAANASTLRSQLKAAKNIYNGASLKNGEPATSWIMSIGCAVCSNNHSPDASYYIDEKNRTVIQFDITSESSGLFDPESFVFGNTKIGCPDIIEWESTEGWTTDWFKAEAKDLWRPETVVPYCNSDEFINHTATGVLRFIFLDTPTIKDEISGKYLSGRKFVSMIKQTKVSIIEPEVIAPSKPILSSALLSNHPNPFNQQTTINFDVPATISQGLVWKDGQPSTIDIYAAMPYSSTSPSVSLRIYTVSGREILLLENSTLGIGSYSASWDGTDSMGRYVSAGTYFCKLQIDKWSVTKRITIVR
jgi:hypothetical protein